MLSQRLAKAALIANLLEPEAVADAIDATTTELNAGMAYLTGLPLSNPEIGRDLEEAAQVWKAFQLLLDDVSQKLTELADLSEALLDCFDRLTTRFERAMQVLVSPAATLLSAET